MEEMGADAEAKAARLIQSVHRSRASRYKMLVARQACWEEWILAFRSIILDFGQLSHWNVESIAFSCCLLWSWLGN